MKKAFCSQSALLPPRHVQPTRQLHRGGTVVAAGCCCPRCGLLHSSVHHSHPHPTSAAVCALKWLGLEVPARLRDRCEPTHPSDQCDQVQLRQCNCAIPSPMHQSQHYSGTPRHHCSSALVGFGKGQSFGWRARCVQFGAFV